MGPRLLRLSRVPQVGGRHAGVLEDAGRAAGEGQDRRRCRRRSRGSGSECPRRRQQQRFTLFFLCPRPPRRAGFEKAAHPLQRLRVERGSGFPLRLPQVWRLRQLQHDFALKKKNVNLLPFFLFRFFPLIFSL